MNGSRNNGRAGTQHKRALRNRGNQVADYLAVEASLEPNGWAERALRDLNRHGTSKANQIVSRSRNVVDAIAEIAAQYAQA